MEECDERIRSTEQLSQRILQVCTHCISGNNIASDSKHYWRAKRVPT